MKVTIEFSSYLCGTMSSTELLTEVKGYTESLNDALTGAQWSQALGRNLLMQDRWKEANSELMNAREKYIETDCVLGATQCSPMT